MPDGMGRYLPVPPIFTTATYHAGGHNAINPFPVIFQKQATFSELNQERKNFVYASICWLLRVKIGNLLTQTDRFCLSCLRRQASTAKMNTGLPPAREWHCKVYSYILCFYINFDIVIGQFELLTFFQNDSTAMRD
jgi:hypothetical protein